MVHDSYLNFDLKLEPTGDTTGLPYRIEVESPGGQATRLFDWPFAPDDPPPFPDSLLTDAARVDIGLEAARAFGLRLFEAIFQEDVRACWLGSLAQVQSEGGLRLRLRLTDTPELAVFPWEYLYSAALDRFLALSTTTPVVRFLDLPNTPRALTVTAPLRMLVVIADPVDYPRLEVEQEWERLTQGVQPLIAQQRLILERLDEATLSALQQALRQHPYHILHFIGHGVAGDTTSEGRLVLEAAGGHGQPVEHRDLGLLLHDHRSLRLLVLNACVGGQSRPESPFTGIASNLVRQGCPAVIGMQTTISDTAALIFAQEFYRAMVDGYPVDTALAEARKRIFTAGHPLEWAIPTLHLRVPDGQIFQLAERPVPQTALLAAASTQATLVTESPRPTQALAVQPYPVPLSWLTRLLLVVGLLSLGLNFFLGLTVRSQGAQSSTLKEELGVSTHEKDEALRLLEQQQTMVQTLVGEKAQLEAELSTIERRRRELEVLLLEEQAAVDLETRYLVVSGMALFGPGMFGVDEEEPNSLGVVQNQTWRALEVWQSLWSRGGSIVEEEGGVVRSHGLVMLRVVNRGDVDAHEVVLTVKLRRFPNEGEIAEQLWELPPPEWEEKTVRLADLRAGQSIIVPLAHVLGTQTYFGEVVFPIRLNWYNPVLREAESRTLQGMAPEDQWISSGLTIQVAQ